MMFRCLTLFVAVILSFVTATSVRAAEPNAELYVTPLDQNIQYYVLAQDIRGALRDVSTQIGVPIIAASNIKGKAAAGKYEGKARDVLDSLASDLNLHWYYDGRSIYVTGVQDSVMHVVRLTNFSYDNLHQALKLIKVDTEQFPIKFDEANNMAVVYGPPRYVATVEVVAHYLTMRSRDKPAVLRN